MLFGRFCAALFCLVALVPSARAADPKPATDAKQKAKACFDEGDFDGAIAGYTEAIRLSPNDASLRLERGHAYWSNWETDKAIADCSEAIRLEPNNAEAYACRASGYAVKRDYGKAIDDCATAIRLKPGDASLFYRRARVYLGKGDVDTAIADLDTAIRLSPGSAEDYEMRGCLRAGRGDYDAGILDLETAVRLRPGDAAAKFEDWPKNAVSAEALKHGEKQVEQMLKDRPAMAQYGKKADKLCRWAARKFAGEDLGSLVDWDSSDPWPEASCDNRPPCAGYGGVIRVRAKHGDGPEKGEERPFEELWANAVFELYNVANAEAVTALAKLSRDGKVSKKEFIVKIAEIEARAIEKQRSFYIHVVLPWAKDHRVATRPELWCHLRGHYSTKEYILLNADKDGPYRRYLGRSYDLVVLHSLMTKGEHTKAVALATQMLEQAPNEAKAQILWVRSRLYDEKGNYEKALADATRAIQLQPHDPVGYLIRASVDLRKGDFDNAIADYSEGIRLAPDNTNAYLGRAAVYSRKNDFDRAIIDCSEAIVRAPKRVELYDYRAWLYNTKGKFGKAIDDCTTAIHLRPADAALYIKRAYAYQMKGDLDRAIVDYTEAIRLNPNSAEAYNNRACAYEKKGDRAKAEADFAQTKRLGYKPEAPTPRNSPRDGL